MTTGTIIDIYEFNELVIKTYGKPYDFQQQDGCKDKGIEEFTIPEDEYDFENTTLPEIVNGEDMGISFSTWLDTDPSIKKLDPTGYDFTDLWWTRNFYPHITMILNDLYKKKLIPSGAIIISIDW